VLFDIVLFLLPTLVGDSLLIPEESLTFLGNPSPRVRDELWKKVTNRPPLGYVLQIWSSPTPQGFTYRQYGESKRQLVDFEGIALAVIKKKPHKKESGAQTHPEE
jgi:CRISPR-associated protein Cas2